MRPVHSIFTAGMLGGMLASGLAACGMAQQSLHETVSAEATPAPLSAGLRATHPEMFTCEADADCVTAPKSGCHNGIVEAVRRDAAKAYVHLAKQQRPGACAFIWVEDRRVAHCHPERRQCELTTASSEMP